MNSSASDEDDNGVSVLEQIIDPFEAEEEEEEGFGAGLENLELPSSEFLDGLSSDLLYGFCDEITGDQTGQKFTKQQSLGSYKASSGGDTVVHRYQKSKDLKQIVTSSPISVLDDKNQTSSSDQKLVVQRNLKRSKPERLTTLKSEHPFAKDPFPESPLAKNPDSKTPNAKYHFDENHVAKNRISENPCAGRPFFEHPCTEKSGKKKPRKEKSPKDGLKEEQMIRKCLHCETTKTPQWREGPCGPKTLCNACGMRFRTGRLLPEYRPATSPSFVPSLHSNSHRKVIEMRKKTRAVTVGGS